MLWGAGNSGRPPHLEFWCYLDNCSCHACTSMDYMKRVHFCSSLPVAKSVQKERGLPSSSLHPFFQRSSDINPLYLLTMRKIGQERPSTLRERLGGTILHVKGFKMLILADNFFFIFQFKLLLILN